MGARDAPVAGQDAPVAARPRRRPWHPAVQLELLHAAPAATVITVGLAFGAVAARAHLAPGRLLLLAVMLVTQQYAAGALNDAVDAPLDAAAGRGKPIQQGEISRRATATLAIAAGAASLAAALALGPATVALATVGLGCAWAYDLWLKRTPASLVPFAVALPLVPLFGYAAAGRFPPVLWWAWPIGSLAAVAVHLADSLPDVETDAAAGDPGLAARVGVGAAATLVAVSYAGALTVATLTGLAAGRPAVVAAGSAGALGLGAAALAAGRRGGPAGRRVAYRLLLAGVVALALGWAAGVQP